MVCLPCDSSDLVLLIPSTTEPWPLSAGWSRRPSASFSSMMASGSSESATWTSASWGPCSWCPTPRSCAWPEPASRFPRRRRSWASPPRSCSGASTTPGLPDELAAAAGSVGRVAEGTPCDGRAPTFLNWYVVEPLHHVHGGEAEIGLRGPMPDSGRLVIGRRAGLPAALLRRVPSHPVPSGPQQCWRPDAGGVPERRHPGLRQPIHWSLQRRQADRCREVGLLRAAMVSRLRRAAADAQRR